MSDGAVQSHDGAGQRLKVGDGLRVGELPVLEVAGLEVDHSRYDVGAEPCHHRTQLGVYAQVVVVGCAHPDEAAGLPLHPFNRHMVQQVLQCPGEGRSENRGGDEVHIRRYHSLHHSLRVVIVAGERTPIGEGNPVVAEVQSVHSYSLSLRERVRVRELFQPGQRSLYRLIQPPRPGYGPVDGEKGRGHV